MLHQEKFLSFPSEKIISIGLGRVREIIDFWSTYPLFFLQNFEPTHFLNSKIYMSEIVSVALIRGAHHNLLVEGSPALKKKSLHEYLRPLA